MAQDLGGGLAAGRRHKPQAERLRHGRAFREIGARKVVGALVFLMLVAAAAPACAAALNSSLDEQNFSFATRILPILTKAGCNSGACHGAATGQGGFKLSLLGYDPEEDFERITREVSGRRLDFASPAQSLFLRKPTREIEHEGGRRIPRDSDWHRTLVQWIAAGAPYGTRDLHVASVSVSPPEAVVRQLGQTIPLRVTALLSDGTREDVTGLALYSSNDDSIAEIDKTGVLTTRAHGATSVMVRYGGQVAAARVIVPYGELQLSDADFPSYNFIDEYIRAELQRLGLPPSGLSDTVEFLRRASLDLTGCLPTSAQTRAALAQTDSVVWRQQVIDDLLRSEAFVDFWTMRFADLLLIGGRRSSEAATRAYQVWLRDQIARGTPFHEIARALLTAQGAMSEAGPANFFSLATDPRDLAEHVGQIFLGTQIACARCHAHPADRWTQSDYHQFAAYFARISTDAQVVKVTARGEVEHPKTNLPLSPKPLGASAAPANGSSAGNARAEDSRSPTAGGDAIEDRRLELVQWMVSPENPLFARNAVNRVWKHLLGRGLVEPVDDLRPTNPATHPALLDRLASDFVKHGYDLRWLIRTIVSSRTYQLTSRTHDSNRRDDRFYSHALLKELPAQVFLDAVAQATGVPHQFEGYDTGVRAVQLIGVRTPSYALDVLGRCSRERSCDAPGQSGGGLAQALHLINGETISGRVGDGIVAQQLARGVANRELIEELYLRTLTRLPTAAEAAEWEALLSRAADRAEAAADLLWALLNSRAFAFNH